DSLREEDDQNLADYADRAAEKLSRVENYLKRQDLGQLLDDVEATARRRPELVFGGLLIAGLATARFLKASSRSRSSSRSRTRIVGPGENFPASSPGDGQQRLEYASARQPSRSSAPEFQTRQAGASGTSQTRSSQS